MISTYIVAATKNDYSIWSVLAAHTPLLLQPLQVGLGVLTYSTDSLRKAEPSPHDLYCSEYTVEGLEFLRLVAIYEKEDEYKQLDLAEDTYERYSASNDEVPMWSVQLPRE